MLHESSTEWVVPAAVAKFVRVDALLAAFPARRRWPPLPMRVVREWAAPDPSALSRVAYKPERATVSDQNSRSLDV